uniref:Uncharacterized protein n=1 Tax=Rhodnius prolixus TaxID=13249 RepID=T1HYI4_RHOPR
MLGSLEIPHPLDFLLCHVVLSVLSPALQEEFRKRYLGSFDVLPTSAQVLDFLKDQEDRFAPKLTLGRSVPVSVGQPTPSQVSPPPTPQPRVVSPVRETGSGVVQSPKQVRGYTPRSVRFVPRPPRIPSPPSHQSGE